MWAPTLACARISVVVSLQTPKCRHNFLDILRALWQHAQARRLHHTLILTNVPITIALQRNKARRFITLLDALYEARCKLLVTVEAGPDDTFSPEIQPRASTSPSSCGFSSSTSSSHVTSTEDPDATYAETFPEAYQDATAPFRPNVSSYEPSLSADALENGPPNQARRPGSSCSTGEATATAPTLDARQPSPARTSASRTSARSRLWEMCGPWRWACEEPGWWRPLPLSQRRWETPAGKLSSTASIDQASYGGSDPTVEGAKGEGIGESREVDEKQDEVLVRHGASPIRTHAELLPKISWTHV